MPNYRRNRIPGGTYFFTVNLLQRNSRLLVEQIDVLREAIRITRQKRSFHIDAWVVYRTICIAFGRCLLVMMTIPGVGGPLKKRFQSRYLPLSSVLKPG